MMPAFARAVIDTPAGPQPIAPPRRPRRIALDGAVIEWWSDKAIVRFADGAHLVAVPHDTGEYGAIAHALGFGTGPLATLHCAWTHDLSHLWLARLLGAPDLSHTVPWHMAHGTFDQLAPWAVAGEEGLACAWQRYLQTGYPESPLACLVLRGVDLAAERRHWARLLEEAA